MSESLQDREITNIYYFSDLNIGFMNTGVHKRFGGQLMSRKV